ncbi:LacI family DNA-binding transcriptional regulator [Cohnella sp. GCM10012308]|uniref:LacI family DNA-binding transcriptional regulator n=1 Tax=Cohnella sp. GCM10012308 TaxID=3317329 RepID=UPI0036178521
MKKITLQMIADRLSVSKALVSKALAGDPAVNEGTRETIWKTAEEMGYRFRSARRFGPDAQPGIMAVLMPRAYLDDMEYWGNVIQGIEQELLRHNFSMLLSSIDISLPPKDGLLSSIDDHQVSGAIAMGHLPDSYIEALKAKQFPFILVDASRLDPEVDHILANNYLGAYEATAHLLEAGHRRLGFVGDADTSWSFRERYRGFRESVADFAAARGADVETLVIGGIGVSGNGMYTAPELDEQIRDAVRSETPVTGLFCANDLCALETLKRLGTLGVGCPDDLSIVGFDDLTLTKLMRPNLTTVRVPKSAIGARAAELIVRRIQDPELVPELVLLSTSLIKRDSVKDIQHVPESAEARP